jgi:hypothetical protein
MMPVDEVAHQKPPSPVYLAMTLSGIFSPEDPEVVPSSTSLSAYLGL